MALYELRRDVYLRKLSVVGLAYVGQTLCVYRAFPHSVFLPVLCGLMLIASLRCWLTMQSHNAHQAAEPEENRRYWTILLSSILGAFILSKFRFIPSTGNQLIDVAQAVVFSLLLGQIVVIAFRRFGHIELLVLATITTVTSFVCVSEPITLYRQVAESAIAICFFALLSNTTTSLRSSISPIASSPWQRFTIAAILLALVVVVSRPVASAMDMWLPSVQLRLSGAIEESIIEDYRTPTLASRYVDSASLNDVLNQYEIDPDGIALRVYAEQSPGYLRGRAFDIYRDGRWIQSRSDRSSSIDDPIRQALQPQALTPNRNGSELASALPANRHDSVDVARLNRFLLRSVTNGPKVTFEIENDPRRGDFFFLPLQAGDMVGVGRRLIVDPHGIVRAGLDTRHTYVTSVYQMSPHWDLSRSLRTISLQLPPNVASRFVQISDELCGDAVTARLKARRLSEYFQHNYRYSLDHREVTKSVDPIQNFLTTRHPAHCEYFASATALLLRAQDIPTRYVTGYIVNQKAEDEEYWFASNRNAHAWVEAYDDVSKRWFIVESTPGHKAPEFTFASEKANAKGSNSEYEDALDDSWFNLDWRLWRLLRAGQWSLVLVELSEHLRWLLLIVTVALIYRLFWRQISPSQYAKDKYSDSYRKLLRAADRRLGRLGLWRSNSETIHAFAERIESVANASDVHKQYANWYREFAESRYKSLAPNTVRPFPRCRM